MNHSARPEASGDTGKAGWIDRAAGFRPGAIAFLELWRPWGLDWVVKIYGVGEDGEAPAGMTAWPQPDGQVKTAKRVFLAHFGWAVGTASGDGPFPNVGFAIVGPGAQSDPNSFCVAVHWWADGDRATLRREIYRTDPLCPGRLTLTRDDRLASVGELRVMAFEARAWTHCVLAHRSGRPDLDRYLRSHLRPAVSECADGPRPRQA